VVDDHASVRDLLQLYLTREGFEVTLAADGSEALRLYHTANPDLILLDLILPAVHGLEVCRTIRRTSRVPIVMLTALSDEADRVGGLELGADDYITKPFSAAEVAARVKAILRRRAFSCGEGEVIDLPGLHIDRLQHRVEVSGVEAQLTPTEFRLLWYLASRPEHVLTRAELAVQALRAGHSSDSSTVLALQIQRLRGKLKGCEQLLNIATVRGIGYRLESRNDTVCR
jgi:two-component system, OmpR family, response regulator ResD